MSSKKTPIHSVEIAGFKIQLFQITPRKFAVRYGLQLKTDLIYPQAAAEYGQCIMHALACEGLLENGAT